MDSSKEKLTLETIMERISIYKEGKPNHSIESIGMMFTTSANTYFFDTGTGKVFKTDEALETFLNELLFGNHNLSEMQEIVEKTGVNIQEVLECIESEDLLKGTKGEHLYCKEFFERAEAERNSKCKQLILELTGACNLRCKYCIYSSSEKAIRDFNSRNMKKETIVKAIDYLKANGDSEVYVTFYGGEPLICFDSMKFAIEYAMKTIEDKKLHFGFTTNLTLMTREKAEYLAQIPNLNIVCSIDGPEDIHDANRVYVGGKGTYKDAIKGLNILKEEVEKAGNSSVTINYNAVYMVPYKKDKLIAINENFEELCKVNKDANYNITYPTSGTIPEEYAELIPRMGDSSLWEWMAELAKESDSLEQIKNRGVIDALVIVHDRMLTEKASCAIPMNACCIPGTRRLYIDTEGDMYVCERINKSPKIGNVDSGIDIDTITAKYYHEYSDKSIAFCANCWAAKMCPFCYSDRMTENGISENAHLHCAEARAHLKKQFSLYHELLETSPEKLAVLNKYVTQ